MANNMTTPSYFIHWFDIFISKAEPVTPQNPLAKGWCVYVEAVDFD